VHLSHDPDTFARCRVNALHEFNSNFQFQEEEEEEVNSRAASMHLSIPRQRGTTISRHARYN
jgi:hypothetical protein